MDKILVSACLMGQPVRYDGGARTLVHAALARWHDAGQLVVYCPEVAAGLPTPRPPAEIADAGNGDAVLAGLARVRDCHGADVSDAFLAGAYGALRAARAAACRFALLTDGSPSCGSTFIYDGSFASRRQAGAGVTASLLRRHGIEVFAPAQIALLCDRLASAGAG